MRRPNLQFHQFRERGRAFAAGARRRLEPARGRVVDWTRTAMDSEIAPMRPGKPGLAEKVTGGLFLLLVAAVILFLIFFDWNLLRGPIGRYASARFEREISLNGDLDVDLFRAAPRATVEGLRIGPPEWAPRERQENLADIPRLTAEVKFWPLLAGDVDMPLLQADDARINLYRDAQGRESWRLGNPESNTPGRIPLIRRLVIDDGRVAYRDVKRRVVLDAVINSREYAAGGPESAFRLDGKGTLNGNPLTLTVKGGALVNIRKDRPYDFTADLRGGATRLTADGSITRPFDLGRFNANLTVSGPDLADIFYITTLPAPNTPPYRISGRLSREQSLWQFNDFSGRVGDSDLSGDLSVQTAREKPLLKATLRSRSLDMDDLFAVVGGAPSTGKGETVSPNQAAMASNMRAQGRMLPDAPLAVGRLRAVDAEVDFRAGSVKRNEIALRRVHIGADLKNAVLKLDPVAFTFARGELNGNVSIDARKAVPFTSADIRLRGYPVETVVPAQAGSPTLTGLVNGRAKLAGSGMSVHEAASNASGQIAFVMPSGNMRQAFAELLGINVGKGLSLLLSKDPKQTPVNCAVADFAVSGGVARSRHIVIDTGVVVARGKGTINLSTERLNIEIDGKSKQPRLLRLWSPITVNGPIRQPKLGIRTGQVAAQGGVAAALGALVNPLAAILPFVDLGGAKDANCAALEAGRAG